MQCNFPGHELENFLGLCFNQGCALEPRFCYFCKEEQHSSHQNKCIRFDVLNKSIVDVHNIILKEQEQLRECQKQISTCFRNLLNSNFSQKIDQCQKLHKILQSKSYEEAKANTNMLQQYYNFDKQKLGLYTNRIQCISEEFMNNLNQISIIDQNDESPLLHIDDSDNNQQHQSQCQPQMVDQQQQILQSEQQNYIGDDDEALLQLILKESQEEDYFLNIQKSDEILNQAKLNLSNHNYSMPLIEQSIQYNNQNDEALFIKASLLMHQQKDEEAIKYFKQVIQLNPFNADACIELAQILFKQNKLNEAEAVYYEAIKKNPKISQLYSNRAGILNRLGRIDESIKMCDQAIQIDNNNASAYNNKAGALARLSKNEEALANYDMAVKLKGNNTDFQVNKGYLLLEMNKVNEAQSCFDKIQQLGQDNPHTICFKCEFLMQQQKTSEALENCKKGLAFYPNDHELQSMKVMLENIINQKQSKNFSFQE